MLMMKYKSHVLVKAETNVELKFRSLMQVLRKQIFYTSKLQQIPKVGQRVE